MTTHLDDLEWLRDHLQDLWQTRLWGSKPRWRERELSDDQRAAKDEEARLERAWLDLNAQQHMPGFSRAPLRVEILDLWTDLLTKADDWHQTVAQTIGHPRLDPPSTAYVSPRPYLAYLIELLPEAIETAPAQGYRIIEKAAIMRERVRAAIGEIEDGQVLKAVCPFCLGITPKAPTGGAFTLRFRSVPRPTRKDREATEMLVVCESGGCEPLEAECSTWLRGRPAWPWTDWDWLAKRLIAPAA